MKKGLILYNAYASEPSHQVLRMSEELSSLGVAVAARRNDFFPYSVKKTVSGRLEQDFCLYLDKDKYTARLMEKQGLRLFDSAAAIELCDDKMLTHIALANNGVPMPETLPGLLCYYPDAQVKKAALDEVEARLGYPLVVKQAFGSRGSGVFLARNRAELENIAESVKLCPHLFQRYIADSHGRDMRVIVIGGEVIGGIYRISDTDFRSNIGLGARAECADVPRAVREIAVNAARILGLDYCGMDFLMSDEPLLCEVNSNAFFDAFEKTTGINVAAAYAKHIVDSMK